MWQKRAACRDHPEQMVPDDQKLGVALAKKICMECPVVQDCLNAAEAITASAGPGSTQGVWGGLTERERTARAVLGRAPIPCSRCGQRCVPLRLGSRVCSVCGSGQFWYADFRPLIEQLLEQGLGTDLIALRLRLDQQALEKACRRWRLARPPARPGRPVGRNVKPCGTLAAKSRHQKRGENWRLCACRNVAWRKGAYR